MKIVYLDAGSIDLPEDPYWKIFDRFEDFTKYNNTDDKQVLKRAEGANIIITNKAPLRRMVIDQLPDLKCICVIATGYDIVDVEAASNRGIPVFNVEGYGTNAVAEHVFAYIFRHEKKVVEHFDSVNNGDWYRSKDFAYTCSPIGDLYGKTLGIVGFGKIAQQVAKIARVFDMNVCVSVRNYNRFQSIYPWIHFKSIDDLLVECDYISLHLPYTPETHELFDAVTFEKMKKDAVLINTARGKIVAIQDLANALTNNTIAAAYLDVLDQEPPYEDHPLIELSNCFVTPHNAWKSANSMHQLLVRTAENIDNFTLSKWETAINFKIIRNK